MQSTYDYIRYNNLQHITLPRRNELLDELSYMTTLISGRMDTWFCNNFINESTQLLINSIFLMEYGYFDCAFYSIRQSSEVLNNMLLLATDKKQLNKWKLKGHFPLNTTVLSMLKDQDAVYNEFRSTLTVFFDEYEELTKQSHKIIHKQGFDTFYGLRKNPSNKIGFNLQEEIKLFEKLLSYSICKLYLFYIILDPLALLLADETMDKKINFDPLTEPANLKYLERHLPQDSLNLLFTTKYYRDLKQSFESQEELNDATYNVVRYNFYDLKQLGDIEKQKHLLNINEQVILDILKLDIPISSFHIGGISLFPYSTTIESNYKRMSCVSNEFDCFLTGKQFNNQYKNIFVSRLDLLFDKLFLEHNNTLTQQQIEWLVTLIDDYNETIKPLLS